VPTVLARHIRAFTFQRIDCPPLYILSIINSIIIGLKVRRLSSFVIFSYEYLRMDILTAVNMTLFLGFGFSEAIRVHARWGQQFLPRLLKPTYQITLFLFHNLYERFDFIVCVLLSRASLKIRNMAQLIVCHVLLPGTFLGSRYRWKILWFRIKETVANRL
jgi:hypothetical protein